MVRRAEQHGLLLERHRSFAMLQDPLGHVARLVGLVAHRDKLRAFGGGSIRSQVLLVTLGGEIDDRIRGREDRLRRAIVAVKRNDVRRRCEKTRKIQNVAHRRGAKRIDRLGIIADDRQPLAIRFERNKDRSLQAVGVLVFVDQHVIEPRSDLVCDRFHLHHLRPVEEQIVVIEYVLPLLGLDIGAE